MSSIEKKHLKQIMVLYTYIMKRKDIEGFANKDKKKRKHSQVDFIYKETGETNLDFS